MFDIRDDDNADRSWGFTVYCAPCTGYHVPMATYKRRIVYLSDEEWAWLVEEAKASELSVSALIRSMLAVPGLGTNAAYDERAKRMEEISRAIVRSFPPVPKLRPAFTPVPKPAPRKKR